VSTAAAKRQSSAWWVRHVTSRMVTYTVLTAGAVAVVFPFIWMILTSFKNVFEAIAAPPILFPRVWRWQNYVDAWNSAPFARYFANTLFIAAATTGGMLVTSVPAAYAFARMRFPGRNVLFLLFLATMMIPTEVTLIPNYITVYRLGWLDKYPALIVPFVANVFGIFLLRQFFMSVPDDLHDAAKLDGCGHARFLWHVALPLSVPALITVSLFEFLGSYNALLWPLLVTQSPHMRPIQVGLTVFQTENQTDVHLQAAASAFVTLPVILLYLAAQRRFIEGIARSGLKG
jgi:multiple sugar transport system permease protein